MYISPTSQYTSHEAGLEKKIELTRGNLLWSVWINGMLEYTTADFKKAKEKYCACILQA